MRIVCGTDFSAQAARAADVAAALAVRSKSRLKLVHALGPDPLDLPQANYVQEKLRRNIAIVREGNRLRGTGAEVVESLAIGRPHEVLANAAPPSKADLIMVAAVGRAAPNRWLAGSVAERTAQLSRVPILAVRDPESLLSWAQGERVLNVVVGYDFSASSNAALRWVASLTRIGKCRVTVVHVCWPPGEAWRFGIGEGYSESGLIARTLLERDLEERCGRVLGPGSLMVRVIPNWGSVKERLIEQAKTDAADLVVVGTNQRMGLSRYWLGSVSRGVLHHAPTNVVCVPAMEEVKPVGNMEEPLTMVNA